MNRRADGQPWNMTACDRSPRHAGRSRARPRPQDVSLTWISNSDDGPATWAEVGSLDWSRFRLVLGAGGSTGAAFEAGVLLALAIDHDVKPQNASHLVGTSAGSVVASLIAAGLDSEDLAAVVGRTPHCLSRLRPGTFDFARQLAFISGQEWPTGERLSVCCTDTATGGLVVYEQRDGVNLASAVAASCAVPGVMRPVSIDDRVLVDGGVVSPTNADVALDDGDTSMTIVLSPMSGSGARSAVGRATSLFASNRLQSELRGTRSAGGVLVIEPAATLGALVVDDALDNTATTQVLAASFLAPSGTTVTRRHIASHHVL